MPELLTYTKFYNQEDSLPLIALLVKENIPYVLEQEVNQLDRVYIGDGLNPMIALKIPPDRFDDVNQLMEQLADPSESQEDPEYYLYSFTNEELLDVVRHPLEWNAFDIRLATSLLQQNNIPIPKADETAETLENIYMPEKLDLPWIILGYILSILFPFTGIFAGLTLWNTRKTLKNGNRVKMFDASTASHGKILLTIGILRTLWSVLNIAYRVYENP